MTTAAETVKTRGAGAGAGEGPFDIAAHLEGTRLVVVGATGFLGKVWLSMLLRFYPGIGKIFLVVRSKKGLDSEARFWAEVASSTPFDPLREHRRGDYEAFLREKIVPIDADVARPLCGLDEGFLRELSGTIDALVNVAGVVDFNPPLDDALLANAFGVRNLVDLARALGDVPVLHTSTGYVAGYRKGQIDEIDPREIPFPKMGELEAVHWSPEREIDECLDLVAQAQHRTNDAFRQSYFLDQARKNLTDRGEPVRGSALDDELAKVRRRFTRERLIEAGVERATYWGWTNIYTYTKSIGEQILASSGLPFTLVRPTVIESSMSYPEPGWNEGINTMAPLTYLLMKHHIQVPSSDTTHLDIIPVDMVSGGMIAALAALIAGRHRPVYHLGSSDLNPISMHRIVELCGLYKRRYYLKTGKGNPFLNLVAAHVEPIPISVADFYRQGAPAVSSAARGLSGLLRKAAVGPLAGLLKPVAKGLSSYADIAHRNGEIWELYIPFMAKTDYHFVSANMRELLAAATESDRASIGWLPEKIDWRHYMHEVHIPGLERWIWPQIDDKFTRPKKPLRAHDDLVSLLEDAAERHDLAVALQRFESEGFTRVSYRELLDRAGAVAGRLAALGVQKGDRVLLGGQNHPDWPIAYFGILRAGAVAVPVDAGLERVQLANLVRASRVKALIVDPKLREKVAADGPAVLDLHEVSGLEGAPAAPAIGPLDPNALASIIYTSGTTGTPKGVMLTHRNFTALLASLAPVFPLNTGDRVLSVLPLHHTFEFTCGLLLPLSRGARVIYLDELSGERLTSAMRQARVTALVGVPALWQLLERRVVGEIRDLGPVASQAFDLALSFNQLLSDKLGTDLGKVLFGPVHQALGGNLKYLISGGSALPGDTAKIFAGLGLPLAEGYGLTEAAPVLTVAQGGKKNSGVGKPIPGVEIKIDAPDASGVGEVLARGANVMAGYADDPSATSQVLDSSGWLRTGDLGKLDRKGQLQLVGRSKDVIVGVNGENIYPDDVERLLGEIEGISELCVLGVADPKGGERAVCLGVPERPRERGEDGLTTVDFVQARDQAMKGLRLAIAGLPTTLQPQIVLLHDEKLPRTATRKVKRPEVRALVERLLAATAQSARSDSHREGHRSSVVRGAIATIARREIGEIHAGTRLREDLGFDSLMTMELVAALEAALPSGVGVAWTIAAVGSVGEIEAALDAGQAPSSSAIEDEASAEGSASVVLPDAVRETAKTAISLLQQRFYGDVMRPKVTGRAFIPQNRSTIVVANHSSHLDMGLVKYALGSYGQELVALAARDYFFESDNLRRLVVENFTNLAPLDRSGNLRETLREIGRLLDEGKTVLIFPEGTRSTDGQIREFKAAIGHLALRHEVDILPLFLGGTFEAMPKNARLPSRRDLTARIGPPLEVSELRRLTGKLKPAAATRRVALIAQRAVEALRDGKALDLSALRPEDFEDAPKKHPLVLLFEDLEKRFVPGKVTGTTSFYFTLGEGAEAKWSVRVSATECVIALGKPASGTADCVLKTSAEMFTRIVRDGYTPGIPEFMSGTIKSNDPTMLVDIFQKAFHLG
jgi:long-chain acyl-CoA synthetase